MKLNESQSGSKNFHIKRKQGDYRKIKIISENADDKIMTAWNFRQEELFKELVEYFYYNLEMNAIKNFSRNLLSSENIQTIQQTESNILVRFSLHSFKPKYEADMNYLASKMQKEI